MSLVWGRQASILRAIEAIYTAGVMPWSVIFRLRAIIDYTTVMYRSVIVCRREPEGALGLYSGSLHHAWQSKKKVSILNLQLSYQQPTTHHQLSTDTPCHKSTHITGLQLDDVQILTWLLGRCTLL
jgi:hypothetical protein